MNSKLEPYFTVKAPVQLPFALRESLVQYGWVLSLVGGLVMTFSVMGSFMAIAWHGSLSAVTGNAIGPWYWLNSATTVAEMILLFAAVTGLRERSYAKGWKLLFYCVWVDFVSSVALNLNIYGVVTGLLGLVIGLFVLYQVKSYYH